MAWVRAGLVTVHPNPGPDGRVSARRGGRGEKEGRNERRREGRRERKRERREAIEEREGQVQQREWNRQVRECKIVTWNMQRMSLNEAGLRRMRRVIGCVEKNGWEIVLMSEILADGSGVLWLGENENRVVVIHSKRTAVLLRGCAANEWVNEGQQKWLEDRVTAVVFGGMRLVSVYQPLWGSDVYEMEKYRRDLETQVAMSGRAKLIIGGDFNANVGRNESREGVCGRFGVGSMNEAGRDLIEWCEEFGLAYVNSFYMHARRGTWCHPRFGRWYELDGFIMRGSERHRMVVKMRTSNEWDLSDHRPKVMYVRIRASEWRRQGNERRVPRVIWERLKEEEVSREFERMTSELWEGNREQFREGNEWSCLSEIMNGAAERVCGRQGRHIASPWLVGREEEVGEKRDRVRVAVERRNEIRGRLEGGRRLRDMGGRRRGLDAEYERMRMEVKNARKGLKRLLRRLEKEWWNERIRECERACEEGRVGDMYKLLRKIGSRGRRTFVGSRVTTNEFRGHFEGVSKDRYEVDPVVIERAIERAEDMRGNEEVMELSEMLNETPEIDEIMNAMNEMKESAPGEDGVRMCYLRKACPEVLDGFVRMVRKMFDERADKWDSLLRVGVMVPLFKKGNRDVANNYRGICLLAMGSRVLARVIAKRLSWWTERLGLLDENQAGFRKGRSTADVVQVMVRVEEDCDDWRKRLGGQMDEWPVATLLDLKKAYPRVSKPALWKLLERYGMNGKCLETLMDLHECTEYKVRGRDGMSESWFPARGLREGCSTSPILFNIYHQAVMRQAEKERSDAAQGESGVPWRWVPGGSFAGGRVWERGNTETVSVRFSSVLFADDTTVLGMSGEMDDGVNKVKEVMGRWEEKTNEDKEEHLIFGLDGENEARMLGSWVNARVDVSNRIRRAGCLWAKVKGWLKGSRMSKRMQGRVVEACVESSLLYDCQARMWYKREVNKLQKWVDKCYRYVWSNRNGQPLRQMQERGVNMVDVRSLLGVRSIAWKIEKRVLERVGHVVRMGNERLTKVAVFGWLECLEGSRKRKGRKRKTPLYWKRLLREAGVDWTNVERLGSDRDGWKRMVNERMDHLYKWEQQKGHLYEWAEGETPLVRNRTMNEDLVCKYDGCGKRCLSRAGLTMHQKRMHRAQEERVRFSCGMCGVSLETEVAKVNHERACTGGATGGDGRRECGWCGVWVTRGNMARHVRGCAEGMVGQGVNARGGGGEGEGKDGGV